MDSMQEIERTLNIIHCVCLALWHAFPVYALAWKVIHSVQIVSKHFLQEVVPIRDKFIVRAILVYGGESNPFPVTSGVNMQIAVWEGSSWIMKLKVYLENHERKRIIIKKTYDCHCGFIHKILVFWGQKWNNKLLSWVLLLNIWNFRSSFACIIPM